LPSEGTPGLVSPQAAAALRDHYSRVTVALDSARNNTRMNPNLNPGPNPPGNGMANSSSNPLNPTPAFSNPSNLVPSPAQQAQANEALLRTAVNTHPNIDFSEFTQDMITKPPTARFDQMLKQFIAERNNPRAQTAGVPIQRGPSRPTSAMISGGSGGPMAHTSQEGQVQQISAEQAQVAMKLQQNLMKDWRELLEQTSEHFLLFWHNKDF
jgi:hypothetical protein